MGNRVGMDALAKHLIDLTPEQFDQLNTEIAKRRDKVKHRAMSLRGGKVVLDSKYNFQLRKERPNASHIIYFVTFLPTGKGDCGLSLQESNDGWIYCKIGYTTTPENGKERREKVAEEIEKDGYFRIISDLTFYLPVDYRDERDKADWERLTRREAGNLVSASDARRYHIPHHNETVKTKTTYLSSIICMRKALSCPTTRLIREHTFHNTMGQRSDNSAPKPLNPTTDSPGAICSDCGGTYKNERGLAIHRRKCPRSPKYAIEP